MATCKPRPARANIFLGANFDLEFSKYACAIVRPHLSTVIGKALTVGGGE